MTLEDLQRAMFGNRQASNAATTAPAARVPATPALQDIFLGEEIINSGVLNNPEGE